MRFGLVWSTSLTLGLVCGMARISATLSGFERTLLNRLAESNADLRLHTLRLTTGKLINYPRDNPTGFVALDEIQSRLRLVEVTADNVSRASSRVSQAQQTLDLIRTQVNIIRTKAVEDENGALTSSQRAANQAAIDAALVEINRLATSDIDGRRLLDGSADFHVSGQDTTQIAVVEAISLGPAAQSQITISGQVTTAGTRAQLTYTGVLGLVLSGNATVLVGGDRGEVTISVTNGQTLSSLATTINAESHKTGVTASVSGSNLNFFSVDYGTAATANVIAQTGTFNVTGGDGNGTDYGSDTVAVLNGRTFSGDRIAYTQAGAHVVLQFAGGFTGSFSAITVSRGGALDFALSPDVSRPATLAIPGVQPARLGGRSGSLDRLATGGSAAGLAGNASLAIRIVDEALADLTQFEARIDGFADSTIASSAALMEGFAETLNDSIDDINAIDEDEEELLQAKSQALIDNATSAMAIFQQSRLGIVELLRQIAGLE